MKRWRVRLRRTMVLVTVCLSALGCRDVGTGGGGSDTVNDGPITYEDAIASSSDSHDAAGSEVTSVEEVGSVDERQPAAPPRRSERHPDDPATTDGIGDAYRTFLADAYKVSPISKDLIPYPPDNPYTPEKEDLGRLLFFDPILSGENDVACATCHHPDFAFADETGVSLGVAGGGDDGRALGHQREPGTSAFTGRVMHPTPRNSPTVLNASLFGRFGPEPDFESLQFWDGRVKRGLEDQALKPISSRDEMAGDAYNGPHSVLVVMNLLRDIPEYEALFKRAFPEMASEETAINPTTYGKAVAAFERELITPNDAFDRWLKGDDAALTDQQKTGMSLFFGEANCAACHVGPVLSDFDFHALGVEQIGPGRPASPGDDEGRYETTGDEADLYAFRTPPLRMVAMTAPYMHDGVLMTLRDVVEFKRRGGNDRGLPPDLLDPEIYPLDLSDAEVDALVTFLEALTGEIPEVEIPERVPSGLEPVFGAGVDKEARR